MFEITGDDIAALGDADLRTLIGMLCEAEVRRRGLPISAVTWGGSQTAKDGGLDVRVALPAETVIAGFIPNPKTGFQIKKPDMPRRQILDEMKSKSTGVLRPVLTDLAELSGAYIIVSSGSSTSDSALKSRRSAMAEAVKDTVAEGKLSLDFYDRNRVATWVRDHAGLIPWVRSRIGRGVPGWQSHSSWSRKLGGADASYITDDQARIRTSSEDEGQAVSAAEGINRIRRLLVTTGSVVRLVGLSGVGKTRLAEALFDSRIGQGAIDPSLAIYADVADEPNPTPVGLASDLIAGQTRGILVVDNCTPELHRRLSDIAHSSGSTISVLTIEYDIREDQPEGTDVFVLDTSSSDVIKGLVIRAHPDISQVNAQTIAEFSGGNARVALALASQVEKCETIAGLGEEELLRRLFQQRHDADLSLMSIAQACSLVYSFEGKEISGAGSELSILGSFVGKSAEEVYANVAELKRRYLVQARAQWRAILPHAVANRLAKVALQNIPIDKILIALTSGGAGRLLRSFSRRLGYLGDSDEAREIVESWLNPEGLLWDVVHLDEQRRAMFANVAPVAPHAALCAIETALLSADEATLERCAYLVRLLRSLAYEPAFFERALVALARFTVLSADTSDVKEARNVLESLFHIALSGTHAAIDVRVRVVDGFLRSSDKRIRAVGVGALEALMKTSHFSSHYDFDFGARSRDYGYYPKTDGDVRAWFGAVLKLAGAFALSDGSIACDIQRSIARHFRDLWSNTGCADALDRLAREIAAKAFWREGWIAARQTRAYEGASLAAELVVALRELEGFLRPKDLVSKVRGVVSGAAIGTIDLGDLVEDEGEESGSGQGADYSRRAARAIAVIRELGHDVAMDLEVFETILPVLMNGDHKISIFAEAFVETIEDPRLAWVTATEQFVLEKKPDPHFLCGFLIGLQKRDSELVNSILDEVLDRQDLATWFPILQACVTLDERALNRLYRALDSGRVPIHRFFNLAYNRTCSDLKGSEFRDLTLAIARKPGGYSIALQIIANRLYDDHSSKREATPEVREAGFIILKEFELRGDNKNVIEDDHNLSVVARASLVTPDGIPVVREISRKLVAAAENYEIGAYDYADLMKGILGLHPIAVLDELFARGAETCREGVRFFQNLLRFRRSVLDVVPSELFLTWCDGDPVVRYPLAAALVSLFKGAEQDDSHEWAPVAEELLERAPDPPLVLQQIVRRLRPSSWSGSLATKLEGRLKLLNSLAISDVPALAPAMERAKSELQADIDAERRREKEEDKARNNRFE